MPDTPPVVRPTSSGSSLGVAAMALLGVGLGAAVFLGTVGWAILSTAHPMVLLGLVSAVVLGAAAAAWWTRNRHWRGLAVGLAGFWVGLNLWLIAAAALSGT